MTAKKNQSLQNGSAKVGVGRGRPGGQRCAKGCQVAHTGSAGSIRVATEAVPCVPLLSLYGSFPATIQSIKRKDKNLLHD